MIKIYYMEDYLPKRTKYFLRSDIFFWMRYYY